MITSVSIVEDDAVFLNMVSELIEKDANLTLSGKYMTVSEALLELSNSFTDVVLMDIQLPDGSGIDVVKNLKAKHPNCHIIMNTSFDDDAKIFDSLKAGASGYIVKTDRPEKLLESVHDVVQGGAPMSAGIARRVVQFFSTLPSVKSSLDELTAKENELLQLLSKGFLYKEIAHQLNVSIDTVKKHAGNIYRKLHVSNRTEAINKLTGK